MAVEKLVLHENEWEWGKSALIIKDGGIGVVNVSISNSNPKVGVISGISVLDDHKQQGYGQQMLETAEMYAKEQGCIKTELSTTPDSFMYNWYVKNGYGPVRKNSAGLIVLRKNLNEENVEPDTVPVREEFDMVGRVYDRDLTNGHPVPRDVPAKTDSAKLNRLRLKIYTATQNYSSHLYSDEGWSHVDTMKDIISDVPGVTEVIAGAGEYFNYLTKKFDESRPAWRDTPIRVKTQYGDLEGYIRCHAAGTVEDEFAKYDMTISLWRAKEQSPEDVLESAKQCKGYGKPDVGYIYEQKMVVLDREFLLEAIHRYGQEDLENYINGIRQYGPSKNATNVELAFHSGLSGDLMRGRMPGEEGELPKGKKVVMRARKKKEAPAPVNEPDQSYVDAMAKKVASRAAVEDDDDMLIKVGPYAVCNPNTGHWYDCYLSDWEKALQITEYATKDGEQIRDDGWPTKDYVNYYIDSWRQMFTNPMVKHIEDEDYDPQELRYMCLLMLKTEKLRRSYNK